MKTCFGLRVVTPSPHGYCLQHIPLRLTDQEADVIAKLTDVAESTRGWFTFGPFTKPIVYVATIEASHSGYSIAAANVHSFIVDIENPRRSSSLTKALRQHPEQHSPSPGAYDMEQTTFLSCYNRFVDFEHVDIPMRPPHGGQVLLIRFELEKGALLTFAVLSTILAVTTGAIVGFWGGGFDRGMGVFGSVIGLAGIAVAVLSYALE